MFLILKSITTIFIITASAHWNYDHPEEWGNADTLEDGVENCCGTSYKTQSPINIDFGSINNLCPSRLPLEWWLNPETQNFTVTNIGHNLKIDLVSTTNKGILRNNFVTSTGENKEYCLDSFHIHWGQTDITGSEHTINSHHSALEMHFVHYSCDYNSIYEAVAASPTDKYVLAVVAVLFTVSNTNNPFIGKIVDSSLSLRDEGQTKYINDVSISQLLPSGDNRFYHYKGSLTTPPCTPVVSWHILSSRMTVSEDQLNKLRLNIYNEDDHYSAPNYRPVQTNTNPVYFCPAADHHHHF